MPTRRGAARAALGLASLATVAGTSACQPARKVDRALRLASLAEAQAQAEALASAWALQSDAVWSLAQTLAHGAQSIEYSMTGYPQPKHRAFQVTVGAAALGLFAWRGHMVHDLAEPIPGAPPLEPDLGLAAALARLREAIAAFQGWTQPLQPHFAYGALDKPAYAKAHAMHLANHLQHFAVVGHQATKVSLQR